MKFKKGDVIEFKTEFAGIIPGDLFIITGANIQNTKFLYTAKWRKRNFGICCVLDIEITDKMATLKDNQLELEF